MSSSDGAMHTASDWLIAGILTASGAKRVSERTDCTTMYGVLSYTTRLSEFARTFIPR